jgi:hypothetical protein
MGRNSLFRQVTPGYLATVEDMGRTTGNRFYVDSGASGAGDTAGHGRHPDSPFATLDFAVGQCTANNGDLIYLLPGHNENIGNAQIDLDVAGISVIGLGRGADTPRFDFDHASASIDIGANGVRLQNIRLLPSVTDVLIGIDVEAGATDVVIEDVEALPGEDGAGVDDFAAVVEFKAGCDRGKVKNLKVRQHASGVGYIAGVRLKGASDDIEICGCDIAIIGAGVVAPLNGDTTLSTNLRIHDNILLTDAEPGIEMLTGTTGVIYDNYISTDLATKAASIVCDTAYLFENYYCEVVTETGGIIGTASADD